MLSCQIFIGIIIFIASLFIFISFLLLFLLHVVVRIGKMDISLLFAPPFTTNYSSKDKIGRYDCVRNLRRHNYHNRAWNPLLTLFKSRSILWFYLGADLSFRGDNWVWMSSASDQFERQFNGSINVNIKIKGLKRIRTRQELNPKLSANKTGECNDNFYWAMRVKNKIYPVYIKLNRSQR